MQLAGFQCSIRWINWNQKLTLKTKIFFVSLDENSTTFLHFEKGGQDFFFEGKKVSLNSFFKEYNKVEMTITTKFGL